MFASYLLRSLATRLTIVPAVALLAGCMHAPEFPRRVSVSEVMHNARCELYEGVKENIGRYPWLENWTAAFDFSFVVDRDVNASTDSTYLVPVHAGAFSIGLKANLKQKAKGTYAIGFKITKGLGNFAAYDCDLIRDQGTSPRRLLNGEIGLRRWINGVAPQIDAAWIRNERKDDTKSLKDLRLYSGEVNGTTYTIEFGVTLDGSLLPSWALAFPDKHQTKPGFGLLASEANTHKVIVALVPIPVLPERPEVLDDLSAIVGMVDGKKAIIGRRVCLFDPARPKDCGIEVEKKAELELQLKTAVQERDAARTTRQFAKRNQDDFLKTLPPDARRELEVNLPKTFPDGKQRSIVPDPSAKSEEIAKRLKPADADKLRQVAPEIFTYAQQEAKATREEQEAGRKIQNLREQIQQVPTPVDYEAIRATARARSRAEAEDIAARDAQNKITQEYLRAR